MKKNLIKRLITGFLIICMFIIIVWMAIALKEDSAIAVLDFLEQENSLGENEILEDETEQNVEYEKVDIDSEYKGFEVIAKIEIPKINLETFVLKDYSQEALDTSVTRISDTLPNESGNFCVAGHNYNKGNMFYNLKKLSVGDIFYVLDNEVGKLEYEIYSIYKVYPDDVSCLEQNTNGKKVVTLITCTNNAEMRIIVKAQEVK